MYLYIYTYIIHPDCKQNNEAAHVGILSSQLGRDQHLLHAGCGSLVIQTMLLLPQFAKDNSTRISQHSTIMAACSPKRLAICSLWPWRP